MDIDKLIQLPCINIQVISDNVCPWCFVAKRKMEQAMNNFPNVIFNVEWFPFFLEPNSDQMDPQPPTDQFVSISALLCMKYGEERGIQMLTALRKAGGSVNISWNEDRVSCNTLLSHQLVQFSKPFNKQNETIDAIFSYFFEKAQNISRIDVLVKIAREVGLDPEEARKYLQNSEGEEIVKREAREGRLRHKVTGVPTFMISRPDKKKYRLRFSGAQPVEVFEAAFKQILEAQ
jgi:predicted DsbA family dithiol-disulfide isomerase